MFDLSFSEILLVILAAVIFLKPEDVPAIMRKIGIIFGKVKAYTNEIMQAFEDPYDKKVKGDDGNYYEAYDVNKILPKDERDNNR